MPDKSKTRMSRRRFSQASDVLSYKRQEDEASHMPVDINALNSALRNSMTFSQNFLEQDREVSIYVNDSMS